MVRDGRCLQAMLKATQQQIQRLEKKIEAHLKQDPALQRQVQLMATISGVGQLSAVLFCACVNLDNFCNGRQLAAFIGVSPRRQESGQWQGQTWMCKCGHPQLRASLYMCAMVAKRHNPGVQAFCRRLEERGRTPKQVIGAVMNKLARTIYAVNRDGKPFDPSILAGGLHAA